eukprot:1111575-Pelagomonas_calceolata.AAC.1
MEAWATAGCKQVCRQSLDVRAHTNRHTHRPSHPQRPPKNHDDVYTADEGPELGQEVKVHKKQRKVTVL